MAEFSGVILEASFDHANEKLRVSVSAKPHPPNVDRTMSLKAAENADVSVLVLELKTGGKGPSPWRYSVSMEKSRRYRHVVLVDDERTFVAVAAIEDWKQEWGPMPKADAILPTPK